VTYPGSPSLSILGAAGLFSLRFSSNFRSPASVILRVGGPLLPPGVDGLAPPGLPFPQVPPPAVPAPPLPGGIRSKSDHGLDTLA
jgi:hypothetical protein